jgi:Icc protein
MDRAVLPESMTNKTPVVQFAVVGDVEPKKDVSFANFRKTVACINRMAENRAFAFTASVGDICHQGSLYQYETATETLNDLSCPFYAIMGNEELMEGEERFLSFAARWNKEEGVIPGTFYAKFYAGILFVFATAHQDGRTFTSEELSQIEECIDAHSDYPVMLFTHAPALGIFPEAGRRTMENNTFDAVLRRENVRVVFSGHTHMDLDVANGAVKDAYNVHHIHVPGIERTKVGTTHTPRFRLVTVHDDGSVLVQTHNVETDDFEERHPICFSL